MIAHKKELAISVLLIAFFILFGYYCPINWFFGIPCPGCNMTTSLIYLLKGDLKSSLYYHAMCIPTMLGFLLALYFKIKNKQKYLQRLVLIWATCMLGYYIYRMITIFPNMPMHINEKAIIQRLFWNRR